MPAPRLKFIEPMKAVMAAAPPYNGLWLYEVKFDGFRVQAIKNGMDVELWSRNEKPLHARFPEVVKAISKLPLKSCILEGEVCALDESGRSSFQLLQNQGETNHPVVYYAFDVLFKGAKDLKTLPLTERKARLEAIHRVNLRWDSTPPFLPRAARGQKSQSSCARIGNAGAWRVQIATENELYRRQVSLPRFIFRVRSLYWLRMARSLPSVQN
jgi:ATP-dependent DNA ligase